MELWMVMTGAFMIAVAILLWNASGEWLLSDDESEGTPPGDLVRER